MKLYTQVKQTLEELCELEHDLKNGKTKSPKLILRVQLIMKALEKAKNDHVRTAPFDQIF